MAAAAHTRLARVWGWVAQYAGAHHLPLSLDTLCRACPPRIGASGAGVTVHPGSPAPAGASEPVSASDQRTRRLQELQFTLGEGPCVTALQTGRPVFAAELTGPRGRHRWPAFSAAAAEAGVASMAAVPLVAGAVHLGVFAVYHTEPGPLDAQALAHLQVFADIALQLLLDEQSGVPGQVERWLDNGQSMGRPEVHQASGMVSVQLEVGIAEALVRLRAYAFAHHRSLAEVAADVVTRRLRFEADPVPD